MKILKTIFLAIVGIYGAACLLLYVTQRNLVFSPSTERLLPQEVGLADVDEVVLETQDGHQLYSWYGRAKPGKATLLFFHGNGGSVSSRQDKFRQLMGKGYGLLMLGYPGYGGSEGSPSEAAFISAAELSYNHLLASGLLPSELIVYGESLGSSVAVQLAADKTASGLVLEAPMSSILGIAQGQFPYVPLGMLMKDPFLSIDSIPKVNMPMLFIHGTDDALIPIESGRALFQAAGDAKTFHPVEGGRHNNLYEYPVVDVIEAFIEG